MLSTSLTYLLVLFIIYSNGNKIKNNTERQCFGCNDDLNDGDDTTWCPFCYCGQSNKMTRIIGGWVTEVNEHPWMVALSLNGHIFCGGTLINDLYVLTAAHCFKDLSPKRVFVFISEHNIAIPDESMTQTRKIAKIIKHPRFGDPVKFNNDIALVKLNGRVSFRNPVKPACLPSIGEMFIEKEARVVGWGTMKEGGLAASELMETKIIVFSNEDCSNLPNFPTKSLTSNMMCAGLKDGGHDSCQGDSGGPLLVMDAEGRLIVAGIVSWGIGCGRPNRPGIYTKVNNYLQWIVNVTRDACYCF